MAVSNVAPPHISIEKMLGAEPGVGVGDPEHVAGPDPGRQQRLVGVAEGRVGQEERLLLADPAGERVGPHLLEPLSRARRRGDDGSNRGGAGSARPWHSRPARVTPGKPLTVTSAA